MDQPLTPLASTTAEPMYGPLFLQSSGLQRLDPSGSVYRSHLLLPSHAFPTSSFPGCLCPPLHSCLLNPNSSCRAEIGRASGGKGLVTLPKRKRKRKRPKRARLLLQSRKEKKAPSEQGEEGSSIIGPASAAQASSESNSNLVPSSIASSCV